MPPAKLKLANGKTIDVVQYGEEVYGQYGDTIEVRPIYSRLALAWVVEKIKEAIRNSCDRTILITGLEREGKSTLAFWLAKALDPSFKADQVCLTGQELLDRMDVAEPGSVIVMDEAGAVMFSHEWWAPLQRKLIKAFQVVGKKNLVFILVLPHRSLLNRQLRNRRVTYWFHVYMRGSRRGYARIREAKPNEWNVDVFWDGVFTLVFPKYSGDDWDEYEKRKDAFIHKMLTKDDQFRGLARRYRNRLYLTAYNLINGKRRFAQSEVADLMGLDQSRISQILDELQTDPELLSEILNLNSP